MKKLIFDIEANGLLNTVSKVWCIAAMDYDTDQEFLLDIHQINRKNILSLFEPYDLIIGHNIIGYDLPLLNKLYGLELKFDGSTIIDTALWSRVLNLDRELPKGCPTTIRMSNGKSKRIGPHSLEAHAYSLGHKKVEIDDWENYDEKILDRCIIDVRINTVEGGFYVVL